MNLAHTLAQTMDPVILTLIVFVPLAGALLLALLPDRGNTMQWAALAVTLLTFALTLHLPAHYSYAAPPAQSGAFQFEQDLPWIKVPAIHYHLGVDGLSMWLVVLTGFLAPLGVLISWRAIAGRRKLFYILFLLQQVAMMGIFVALDMFLYYAFWEMSLVPMTLLIATFGRTGKRGKAAMKYFLYAFIPSALLLVAMLWIYARTGTFDLPKLASLAQQHAISSNPGALWLASLAFLLAFAVKVPIFPLHGWLQDAVEEAPTAAVMVLVGKTALYSILRFSFSIFPGESRRIAPLLIALAAIGIVYGALLALVQNDLKRLAAYATLGHLSFIVLGIFTFTIAGLDGGIYHILNESLSGAAFFMLLGLLYERYETYEIGQYGGLAAKLPWVVTLFVITSLAAIGLPMLSGFVGEFLILSGSMQSPTPHHDAWTALATTGVILSAAFMLTMIQRVFYSGLGVKPRTVAGWDLDAREHLALWPMVVLFLAMGVASPIWLRAIDGAAVVLAGHPAAASATSSGHFIKIEAETYRPNENPAAAPAAPPTATGGAR
jgi:NADH-quinone oxidoreductase subunit M